MKLNLLYVHSMKMGYGRYGMRLASSLQKMGVECVDHLNNPDDIHVLHKPDNPVPDADPCNVACWISTPSHALGWYKDQYRVISSMWEATVLPETFRESLHNFDLCLVPSEQNRELFSRYHDNVKKVPLGFEPSEWMFRERQKPGRRFVFLIGGSGPRKGVDLAYKAFMRLWGKEGSWGSGPIPTLIFKSPKMIDYWGPRVEHIGGHISDEAERDLYGMAHCYIQPSRGEGWGLQPMQAIAQGLPTILTDAHGQAEFAHLGYGISSTMTKAEYFVFGDAGEWWEPDLDELCEYMEYVYNNYEEACDFAKLASQVAHEQFTWDKCAERFIDVIGRDRLNLPYRGDGTWVKPTLKKYLIRVRVRERQEHCQTVYQFEPGQDYWEVADVKRVLYEAGKLDLSCVVNPSGEVTELESGLAPHQVEEFGVRSAAQGHCWECGQLLNQPGLRFEPEFTE